MRIFKSQKSVFWQALLFAVLIFSLGLLLGYGLENMRVKSIERFNERSTFYLLDAKIQNELYSFSDINCETAYKNNLDFSNKVYEDFRKLEKYDSANKLSDDILFEHSKYDLLRALFWTTTLRIKESCNISIPNVVYLYSYTNPSLQIRAKQDVFAQYLHELQENKKDKFLLIPLAGDNRVASVNFLMNNFNITEEELPVILLDEKIKISKIDELDKIKAYLDSLH